MRSGVVRLAGVALLAGAGCGPGEGPAPEPPAPDASDHVGAEVRAAVEAELARVRASPEDPARWLELGMLYEANGLGHLAEPAYAGAARVDGEDARAHYHLARARAGLGELEPALASVERAIELDPAYGPLRWWRGAWLEELGRLDAAAEAFRAAEEVDPKNPAGRWGLARIALQRGEPRRALEWLAPLAGRRPDYAYTHHLAADAHRRLGALEEAQREGALAGPPVWVDPWRAEVRERQVGFHRRMAEVRAAVERGELDEAARCLEAMHAADPDDVNVIGMLADVYVSLERLEDAERLLLAGRQRAPEHYRIAFNLSIVHEERGDDVGALAELDACLELQPGFGPAHVRRGRIRLRLGDEGGARADLEEAHRLGDRPPSLLRVLGQLQARGGDFPAAARTLEEGRAAAPEDPFFPLFLAEARAMLGDGPRAWQELERAARLGAPAEALAESRAFLAERVGAPPAEDAGEDGR